MGRPPALLCGVGEAVHSSRAWELPRSLLGSSRRTPETRSSLPVAGPRAAAGHRGQPEAGGADSPPLSGSRGLAVLSSAHAAAENTLVWPGRG